MQESNKLQLKTCGMVNKLSSSHYEVELEEFEEGHESSKAYKVSMTAILVALIFAMAPFSVFIPFPTSFVILYMFRDFGDQVAKAIYVKIALAAFLVIGMSGDLFYIMNWLSSAGGDLVMTKVTLNHSFSFSNIMVFKMGYLGNIPTMVTITISLSLFAGDVLFAGMSLNSILFTLTLTGLIGIVFNGFLIGLAFLGSYGVLKDWLKDACIDKVSVGF